MTAASVRTAVLAGTLAAAALISPAPAVALSCVAVYDEQNLKSLARDAQRVMVVARLGDPKPVQIRYAPVPEDQEPGDEVVPAVRWTATVETAIKGNVPPKFHVHEVRDDIVEQWGEPLTGGRVLFAADRARPRLSSLCGQVVAGKQIDVVAQDTRAVMTSLGVRPGDIIEDAQPIKPSSEAYEVEPRLWPGYPRTPLAAGAGVTVIVLGAVWFGIRRRAAAGARTSPRRS